MKCNVQCVVGLHSISYSLLEREREQYGLSERLDNLAIAFGFKTVLAAQRERETGQCPQREITHKNSIKVVQTRNFDKKFMYS